MYLTPNDTYSLVGAPPPPPGRRRPQAGRESSSVYPEISAEHAAERRTTRRARAGRGNWYSPLNADPSGYANLGLYEALATPSPPFVRRTAEPTAYQYISSKLCDGCNIRELYDDLTSTSKVPDPAAGLAGFSGKNCDTSGRRRPSFCSVRSQLLTELIGQRHPHFYNNVQSLWLGSGTINILSQLSAYNDIKSQLNPPPTASSQSLTSPLVNFFLAWRASFPR